MHMQELVATVTAFSQAFQTVVAVNVVAMTDGSFIVELRTGVTQKLDSQVSYATKQAAKAYASMLASTL